MARSTSLDDVSIDNLLSRIDRRPLRATQLMSSNPTPINLGRGTVGLGSCSTAVAQVTKDRLLYEYLVASERRRRESKRRSQNSRLLTTSEITAEHRRAREEALERRQEEVARARQANAERHAEAIAAEESRHKAEVAELDALRIERQRSKLAASKAKKELVDERTHERHERQRHEAEEAQRLEREREEQASVHRLRIESLKLAAHEARRAARESVADLRLTQRRAAADEGQRLAALVALQREDDAKQLEANKRAIDENRRGHRDRMAAAKDERAKTISQCREFAKTPCPAAEAIALARSSRVEKVRDAIKSSRELKQPKSL